MSSTHSPSPVISNDVDSSLNRIDNGPASDSSPTPVASSKLDLASCLAPIYATVVAYVRNSTNYNGVRSDSVQQNLSRAQSLPPWYWTPDHVAIISKHIRDPDVLQSMLADAHEARDVAKAAYLDALKTATATAVATSMEAASRPIQSTISSTSIAMIDPSLSSSNVVPVNNTMVTMKPQGTKPLLKLAKGPGKGKKALPKVTGQTKSAKAGGGPGGAPTTEGKPPCVLHPPQTHTVVCLEIFSTMKMN